MNVFVKIRVCDDFVEIFVVCLGKYLMYVGEGVEVVLVMVIIVDVFVKDFVVNWLKDDFGVFLN